MIVNPIREKYGGSKKLRVKVERVRKAVVADQTTINSYWFFASTTSINLRCSASAAATMGKRKQRLTEEERVENRRKTKAASYARCVLRQMLGVV